MATPSGWIPYANAYRLGVEYRWRGTDHAEVWYYRARAGEDPAEGIKWTIASARLGMKPEDVTIHACDLCVCVECCEMTAPCDCERRAHAVANTNGTEGT